MLTRTHQNLGLRVRSTASGTSQTVRVSSIMTKLGTRAKLGLRALVRRVHRLFHSLPLHTPHFSLNTAQHSLSHCARTLLSHPLNRLPHVLLALPRPHRHQVGLVAYRPCLAHPAPASRNSISAVTLLPSVSMWTSTMHPLLRCGVRPRLRRLLDP